MITRIQTAIFGHVQTALPQAVDNVNGLFVSEPALLLPVRFVFGWAEPFQPGGSLVSVNLDSVGVEDNTMAQVKLTADVVLVWTLVQSNLSVAQAKAADALILMWVRSKSFGGAVDFAERPDIVVTPPASGGKDMGLVVATWKIKKGEHYG